MNEINQPDDAQAQLQAAIQRFGNDLDRRLQRNAIASDGVVDLSVRAGGIERAFQIADARNCREACSGALAHPRQQVAGLYARALARHVRQNSLGLQTPRSLAPPHSVVGLLELPLLEKVEHGQHEQGCCSQGQQRCLHAVKEACLHGGIFATPIALSARQLPRDCGGALRS